MTALQRRDAEASESAAATTTITARVRGAARACSARSSQAVRWTSDSRSFRDASAISSTAASKASLFARDGARYPLTFLTN